MWSETAVVVWTVLVSLAVFAAPEDENELPECKKRPKGLPFDCCTMPRFLAKLDAKLKSCIDTARADGVCPHSCGFGDNVVLTAEDQFERDAVLAYLGQLFTDADAGFTAEMHEQFTDECIAKIDEGVALFKDLPLLDDKSEKTEGHCSFKPAMLKTCLHHQYMSNCPATAWNDSEKCAAWKDYWQKCPMSFRGRGRGGGGGRGRGHKNKPQASDETEY